MNKDVKVFVSSESLAVLIASIALPLYIGINFELHLLLGNNIYALFLSFFIVGEHLNIAKGLYKSKVLRVIVILLAYCLVSNVVSYTQESMMLSLAENIVVLLFPLVVLFLIVTKRL